MAIATKKSKEEAIKALENVSEAEMAGAEIVAGYRESSGNLFSVCPKWATTWATNLESLIFKAQARQLDPAHAWE